MPLPRRPGTQAPHASCHRDRTDRRVRRAAHGTSTTGINGVEHELSRPCSSDRRRGTTDAGESSRAGSRSGRDEDVTVSAGIDHHAGRIASRPFFDSTSTAPIAPSTQVDTREPGVHPQTYAGRAQASNATSTNASGSNATEYRTDSGAPHTRPQPRQRSTRSGSSAVPVRRRRETAPARCREPIDELLTETRDDLMTGAVIEREQQIDETNRCEATDRRRPFDQPGLGTSPGGRDRGRDARRRPRRRPTRRADR